jgi:hypothetical protein
LANIADTGTGEARAAASWQQRELVAAYVGAGWEYYEKTYQSIIAGRSGLGWSWTLFFFPWIWLTHRKLYLAGIVVWVLDILPRPTERWVALATLAAHVAVAVYGQAFFLKRAIAEVEAVRRRSPSDVAAFDALKDKGIARGAGLFGVAIPLLFIAVAIYSFDFEVDVAAPPVFDSNKD